MFKKMHWTPLIFLAKSFVSAQSNYIAQYLANWSDDDQNFRGLTVYPDYEVSIDLNLAENPHKGWSNILTFRQNGVKSFDSSVPGNIPPGARIPAVYVQAGSTKLTICSTLNDAGDTYWNTPNEMPVGQWFNLKIKESFQKTCTVRIYDCMYECITYTTL